jgi:hypothetical protein
MPDRKMERRQVLDPAVADLLAGMEQKQAEASLPRRQREKKARERAKIQARRDQRVTYDLPPVIREHIKDLAEELRLPASQLVTLALARFLKEYNRGEVELSEFKHPSRSPRYDWNLEFPEDLVPLKPIRKRKGGGG